MQLGKLTTCFSSAGREDDKKTAVTARIIRSKGYRGKRSFSSDQFQRSIFVEKAAATARNIEKHRDSRQQNSCCSPLVESFFEPQLEIFILSPLVERLTAMTQIEA